MKKILLNLFLVTIVCLSTTSCDGNGIDLTKQEDVINTLPSKLMKTFDEETRYVNIYLFTEADFSKTMTFATINCIEPGSDEVKNFTLDLKSGNVQQNSSDLKFQGKEGIRIDEIAFSMITPWINMAKDEMEEAEYPFSGIEYYNIGTVTDEFSLTSKAETTSQRRGKRITYTTNYYEFKFKVDEEGIVQYVEN